MADIAEHRTANQGLVALAKRDLAEFFQSLNVWGDPYAVKAALLEFVPDLVQTYGDTAAVLAADYYDMLRDVPPSAASFSAVLARPPVAEQVAATTRWAIGPLFAAAPDPAGALALLEGGVQRLTLQAGRDTVMESAWMDSVTTGVARVPSGTDTCEFCIMLASRGPVYRSEVSANMVVGRGSTRTGYDRDGKRLPGGIGGGIKKRGKGPKARDVGQTFHDNCDCTTLVIRSDAGFPDGYDPDHYFEMWQQGSGTGRYQLEQS